MGCENGAVYFAMVETEVTLPCSVGSQLILRTVGISCSVFVWQKPVNYLNAQQWRIE